MPVQVMLVDDDKTIIETLEYNLKRHGFKTIAYYSGQTALAGLKGTNPDLIILDWMLGDMSGPDVCKLIRLQHNTMVPILMLTARSTPSDVACGLESGADDYLSKPFSIIEFIARVQALLRRSKPDSGSKPFQVGELLLDPEARTVIFKGQLLDLAPKEFFLLKVLMRNAGKVLPTEKLLNEVWGVDFTGDVKTVAVHIRWLRQKLEDDPQNPQLIKTIHRLGYRLTAPSKEET